MIYYATYNENGRYTGFYTQEIHGDNIPTPNIELDNEKWQEAITGDYSVVDGVHTYTKVDNSAEIAMIRLRSERNFLLRESDWTQFNDSPLTAEKKAEWALYRQALRDLTQNVNINNVVFPTQPQ